MRAPLEMMGLRLLGKWACLSVVAVIGVAPPAVITPPVVRPGASPSVAAVPQMQAGNAGMVASPPAAVASNAQPAPRMRGHNAFMEPLRDTPRGDADETLRAASQ